jgi:hypothetical protein
MKDELFDGFMWLTAFCIKISLLALVIYSVIKFVKWCWSC